MGNFENCETMVCWDCHGYDLPCDTCNGTRVVRAKHLSDERQDEIDRWLREQLGSDEMPHDDY